MSRKKNSTDELNNTGKTVSPASARKAYRKPEFRYEQVFETTALACGKTPATPLLCKGHKKNS
ncbi:MAG TPA: hypothetical protein VFA89_04320 [Terriglobales bacterium]|nr:hypothetical protein [Terriglobales bacterium]